MRHLTILTIICTTTVCSTTVKPAEEIDDPIQHTSDTDSSSITTIAPVLGGCSCSSLACSHSRYWNNYMPVLRYLARIERLCLEFKPKNPLLYPYISGGIKRNDYWPGWGYLHLIDIIASSNEGKLFIAEVDPVIDSISTTDIPEAKKSRIDNDLTTPTTTEGPGEVKRVVIKYSSSCEHSDHQSRLFQEFIFRKLINGTDIAPKVFYLSPEARISPSDLPLMTSRFLGSHLASNLDSCVASGTTVRFMIQEQAGPSLHKIAKYYMHDRCPEFAKFIIEIARSLIDKLEILHSMGIVHGDIHAGNIVFRRPVNDIDDIDTVDFILIDFEHAIFFPSNFGKQKDSEDFSHLTPRYLSLWQLAGERMGPRDDIYRLMYMLGDILSKGRYRDGVTRMVEANLNLFSISSYDEDDHADMVARIEHYVKKNCSLFCHSPELGSKAVTGLPEDLDLTVSEKLDAIHSHIVTTYVDPDMKIDYHFIKASLDEVIALYPN